MPSNDYTVCVAGRRDYYQVALALAESDSLAALVTTSYTPDLVSQWSWTLPGRLQGLAQNRNIDGISSRQTISAYPTAELRRRLVTASGSDAASTDREVQRRLAKRAAQMVAASGCGAVVYNYHWLPYKEALQTCDLPPQILFQPHPAPWQVREILQRIPNAADFSRRHEPEEQASEDEVIAYRESIQEADGILVPTSFVAEGLVQAGIPSKKIAIVPYGGDFSFRAEAIEANPSRFRSTGGMLRLLWVGQITYRKGILTLAEAMARLPKGTVQLTVITNAISHPELLASLPANTVIRVRASDSELRDAYNSHDLLVMPSYLEGSGLVFAEALSFGMPVVGTPHTCLPDLLPLDMKGLIVAPGDAIGLSSLLECLAEDHLAYNFYVKGVSGLRNNLTWLQFRRSVITELEQFEKATS